MWQYIIIGIAVLALIGGSFWFVNHLLSEKDTVISGLHDNVDILHADIAAKITDIEKLTASNRAYVLEINRMKADLNDSILQQKRIQQKDTIINQQQSDFDIKLKKLDLSNPVIFDKFNQYQDCVNKNIGDNTCANILQ